MKLDYPERTLAHVVVLSGPVLVGVFSVVAALSPPPPTDVAALLRAIGSALSPSSAPSASASTTPTITVPSSLDARTAVQSAIPSSLALSETLRLEPATRSRGAPSAATAPPRNSAASAAPSSAARPSRRTSPAETADRTPGASEVVKDGGRRD